MCEFCVQPPEPKGDWWDYEMEQDGRNYMTETEEETEDER